MRDLTTTNPMHATIRHVTYDARKTNQSTCHLVFILTPFNPLTLNLFSCLEILLPLTDFDGLFLFLFML